MTDCLQCRKPVRVYAEDYQFTDGTTHRRKGGRIGSGAMERIDPAMLFCSLRCAATFAVRAAPVVEQLAAVVDDFLPNIGKCVLQDYQRLNDSMIAARRLIPRK